MKKEENCVFCKIAAGEIPCHKIYEDGQTLAFLDINPNNPGHSLVIPKEHNARNILDISDETLCQMVKTARKVAKAAMVGVKADGINIIMNNERPAGQLIFHPHFHIIPRFSDDGYRHWPHKPYGDENEIIETAEKIKKCLGS